MVVEFVSYSGEYPSLCMGVLVLSVDGVEHSFGRGCEFPRFWSSGGCVSFSDDWEEEVDEGEWCMAVLCSDERAQFEEAFGQDFFSVALAVMSEHVEWGCCGGCV